MLVIVSMMIVIRPIIREIIPAAIISDNGSILSVTHVVCVKSLGTFFYCFLKFWRSTVNRTWFKRACFVYKWSGLENVFLLLLRLRRF